jgi:glyoxylase-like metal-dependent hydrolase (beta-lactamase superfamily II)
MEGYMSNQTYSFNVGQFKCVAVSDGTMTYAPPMFPPPPVFLFSNAEETKLSQALQEHGIDLSNWKEWVSPYTCLFIDTGRDTLLIDTGAGNLAESTGKLINNLKEEGIQPGDVNYVILSHGHPDHVGGNLDSSGQPIFSEAKWIIGKTEWDFWTTDWAERELDEHSRDMLINIARKNLLPLKDKIETIETGAEIVAGLQILDAVGHTPGLIALSISSGKDELLCISDALIHPVHLAQPEWHAAVDVLPEQVGQTRHNIVGKAASDKSLVMAFHFPFPGLGYITEENKVWKWLPV